MVTMTEAARDFLASALADLTGEEEAGSCFRLVRTAAGGIQLKMDTQTDEDLAFVHLNRTILVMHRDLAEGFHGRRIDVTTDDEEEPALVIV